MKESEKLWRLRKTIRTLKKNAAMLSCALSQVREDERAAMGRVSLLTQDLQRKQRCLRETGDWLDLSRTVASLRRRRH
eukprot:223581-Prorocentrum_lima.AAC.1